MENGTQEIYVKLLKKVEEAEFGKLFQDLRTSIVELNPYSAPADLLASLKSSNPNHEEKDSCLYGLITAVRRRDHIGTAALTLLVITMWPALILIASRFRYLLRESGDPLAEVYWAFLQELNSSTYNRRWKVAANLYRNTAKRTIGSLRIEWRYQEVLYGLERWANEYIEDAPDLLKRISVSLAGLSDDDREVLAELIQDLAKAKIITEEESLLLVGHAIYSTPLKDLATQYGIGYDSIRQRYSRLKTKLRKHFGLPQK